jgi:hypothetical protein
MSGVQAACQRKPIEVHLSPAQRLGGDGWKFPGNPLHANSALTGEIRGTGSTLENLTCNKYLQFQGSFFFKGVSYLLTSVILFTGVIYIPVLMRLLAICLRRLRIWVAQRFSAAISSLSEDGFSR